MIRPSCSLFGGGGMASSSMHATPRCERTGAKKGNNPYEDGPASPLHQSAVLFILLVCFACRSSFLLSSLSRFNILLRHTCIARCWLVVWGGRESPPLLVLFYIPSLPPLPPPSLSLSRSITFAAVVVLFFCGIMLLSLPDIYSTKNPKRENSALSFVVVT
jgi:hypothetical protein